MSTIEKWRNRAYKATLICHGIFIYFGLYSLLIVLTLGVPGPRTPGPFEAIFTMPGAVFLVSYFILVRSFILAERAPDQMPFAYFSLSLSLFFVFSLWLAKPGTEAKNAFTEQAKSAGELVDIAHQVKHLPEDYYDSYYWLDRPREADRAAVMKALPSEYSWLFYRSYERVEYFRCKENYFRGSVELIENVENWGPAIQLASRESKWQSLIVDCIASLLVTTAVALVLLCEFAPR